MEAEGKVFKKNTENLVKECIWKFFGGLIVFVSATIFLFVIYLYLKESYGIYIALISVASLMFVSGMTMIIKISKGKETLFQAEKLNDTPKETKDSKVL